MLQKNKIKYQFYFNDIKNSWNINRRYVKFKNQHEFNNF